jgi:DUF4097 and DUF4098 domain-containing protein YvlB
MPNWNFPATEPIDLHSETIAGSVTITAQPTDTITVRVQSTRPSRRGEDEADVHVEFADGRLEIIEPAHQGWIRTGSDIDVMVTLPAGSRCSVRTVSADILCEGELGGLVAKTASGEIHADAVTGDVQVTTTSGRIDIEDAAARVTAKSASGAIEIGRAGGDLDVNTVSSKINIGKAGADANVRTASGRIRVGNLARGQADIATVSGEVKVYVAKGVGVYLDMSSLTGRVTSELEPTQASDQVDLHLHCRSISGSVKVGRAELADVA